MEPRFRRDGKHLAWAYLGQAGRAWKRKERRWGIAWWAIVLALVIWAAVGRSDELQATKEGCDGRAVEVVDELYPRQAQHVAGGGLERRHRVRRHGDWLAIPGRDLGMVPSRNELVLSPPLIATEHRKDGRPGFSEEVMPYAWTGSQLARADVARGRVGVSRAEGSVTRRSSLGVASWIARGDTSPKNVTRAPEIICPSMNGDSLAFPWRPLYLCPMLALMDSLSIAERK